MKETEIQAIKQRFGIIGKSPLLNYAIEVAAQVAATDMTVLITGESGVGKESFSKIIHSLSSRKHGPFIAINCGAIPEGTIDSELFGHEKGSFTGASEARKGYFEVTNAGTIFLDEIGEMPLGTQSRLLRVLENGEFIKVGSSKVQKTDVRVVAATNVNLFQAVDKGKFREDLYYRLNNVPIFVPPLRERGSDIELLFRKFAIDFAEKYRMKSISLTTDAKERLLKFRFPGNIRQLKNIVEQISVIETEREINGEVLLKYLPEEQISRVPMLYRESHKEESFSERDLLYKVLFDMKKDMNDLKKLVLEILKDERHGKQILQDHKELFHNVALEEEVEEDNNDNEIEPYIIEEDNDRNKRLEISKIEDVQHETEEDSLSLEKKEKEMIIKALKKNNHKRKHAANDLGISERTLYRKIKQYDLENI